MSERYERTDKRVAQQGQYLLLDSWLFQTTVRRKRHCFSTNLSNAQISPPPLPPCLDEPRRGAIDTAWDRHLDFAQTLVDIWLRRGKEVANAAAKRRAVRYPGGVF